MLSGLGLKDRESFMDVYLNPAIKGKFVRLLYPNSPRHPRQSSALCRHSRRGRAERQVFLLLLRLQSEDIKALAHRRAVYRLQALLARFAHHLCPRRRVSAGDIGDRECARNCNTIYALHLQRQAFRLRSPRCPRLCRLRRG